MRLSTLALLSLTVACSAAPVDAPWGDEMDSDADGLNDALEIELGTDPDSADSDGDGFDDADEVAQGADPTDGTDRPYLGGWAKDRQCADSVSATGDSVGAVTSDFELTDQYGDTVRLYDFCGRAVMLVGSAEWCGACRGEAPHLTELYESYREEGLMVITLLGETDSGAAPGVEHLEAWSSQYGQDFPVVADPGYSVASRFVTGGSIGLPTITLLAPGAEVLIADGYPQTADIEGALP